MFNIKGGIGPFDGARVPVRRVPRARLAERARTEAPQGVLARAEPLADVDLETLCRPGDGGWRSSALSAGPTANRRRRPTPRARNCSTWPT